ncbi:MASE1 domain-containing protein [Pantoea ananatis]
MPKFVSAVMSNFIAMTIWAVLYYLSGVLSLRFDDPQLHISVVWFPAGVATAAFLNSRWRLWPALCVLFVVLDVILDKPSFSRLPTETFYAILDLPSSLIIAWIVKRFSRPGDDLNIIMLWFASTIIISFLDAVLFGIGLSLAGKKQLLRSVLDRFYCRHDRHFPGHHHYYGLC